MCGPVFRVHKARNEGKRLCVGDQWVNEVIGDDVYPKSPSSLSFLRPRSFACHAARMEANQNA